MSVVLDDNQQQHLLVILNDINRHIHESNLIAIASTTSITTTTTTNTNDSNGTIAKKGGGAGSNYNRHPNKRASTIDHHPPSLPQPDMITGFNQNNISQLSNFIINTNRYFVAFYKLTSGDIFECGKTFRNAYKLNRHLYVHKDSSEKPYSCDWSGCAYRSISRNDLNRHKMIHTGEKPYHCDVAGCEKRYSRPDKLRHHKLTIHYKEQHNSGSIKKEQVQSQQAQNHQGKPNQYVTLSAPISIRSANIPGGTVPSDLAQVIANLPQQINNQQQQTTLSNIPFYANHNPYYHYCC
ncbi:hypothetical protein BLOT_008260 [Blomia tropicalis]|nr:hypothetical protein BLOT_008260 [Blomia tropicalis]